MRKIIFIEPRPPDLHIFTRMPLPRLGTVLLGTILKRHGYEVRSYVEVMGDIDLKDVLSADMVGISTITSTAPRAYEIARLLKNLGIPVFMGGPHVTYMPDEALLYCDYVLRGEADEVIADFVRALESGGGLEGIAGLSFVQDGEIIHNKAMPFCRDLDDLPCPDFTILGGIEYRGLDSLAATPIMTSRGCPYDCSFCSVTGMFGQKYRFRSTERVLDELEINRAQGNGHVFFYDDNFCANPKRTKELLSAMIERGLTPQWSAQVRVEVAKDEELLDLMARSNCHTLYIGLESVNPETLKHFNKRQSVEDITACIRVLHRRRIGIHGMFVFGSDYDTPDILGETVRFAKKNDLESVQFLILTPLPGTRCYRDLSEGGRIITRDWSLYDAHHVVYEPRLMNCYELQSETMRATREFYSVGQILKRFARLDMFNAGIKAYGRRLSRKWIETNQYFLDYTRVLATAGRSIELAASRAADDIRDRLREMDPTRMVEPKAH